MGNITADEAWERRLYSEVILRSERCQHCEKVLGGIMKLIDFYRVLDWHKLNECPVKGQKLTLSMR